MNSEIQTRLARSCVQTGRTFINVLPIVVGMLLATSIALSAIPGEISAEIFGYGAFTDAVLGAAIGGIAVGHPLASYLLGGELLCGGAGLVTVTALLVGWVTVGVAQLPAEALVLGGRFAVAIAFVTVHVLKLFGAGLCQRGSVRSYR